MEKEKVIVSFDFAIKNILRDKSNFDILSGFLSELLKKDVEVIEILETESNIENPAAKLNRLDLKAKINDGEIAIFEIQTNTENDFYNRILFGVSRAITEQIGSGGKYCDIKKVYSIDIINFELGVGRDYIYRGFTEFKGLHNNETLLVSEREKPFFPNAREVGAIFPEYYLIYPKRFNEDIRSNFDEWVYVLKNSAVKPEFKAKGIREVGEKLDVMNMSVAERNDFRVHEKSEMVKHNEIVSAKYEGIAEGRAKGMAIGIERGRAVGRAEGIEKGIAEGKAKVAKNLKSLGMTAEQISQATGLDVSEIEKL